MQRRGDPRAPHAKRLLFSLSSTVQHSENGEKRQADRVTHDALRITRKADFTSQEGAIP